MVVLGDLIISLGPVNEHHFFGGDLNIDTLAIVNAIHNCRCLRLNENIVRDGNNLFESEQTKPSFRLISDSGGKLTS